MGYGQNFTGSRYDSTLSTTEVSKRIRSEIKDLVKAGTLPESTYSVRTRYFAGGSSIEIEARNLYGAWVDHEWKTDYHGEPERVLSSQAQQVLKTLQGLHDAYNYDHGDVMVDYYNVNYYGFAEIEIEWSAGFRARQAAKKAAQKVGA
jgi:hypothetical protein